MRLMIVRRDGNCYPDYSGYNLSKVNGEFKLEKFLHFVKNVCKLNKTERSEERRVGERVLRLV